MHLLISITFDDGFRRQFETALPIVDSYGLKATFFLIANDLPTHDRCTGRHDNDWWKIDWRADDIVMLEEVVEVGHEIGSHSVSHHPDMLPIQPESEAREFKRVIDDRLSQTFPRSATRFTGLTPAWLTQSRVLVTSKRVVEV